MASRIEEFRNALTPSERTEIKACARRLRNWFDSGLSRVEQVGRPKKFFGHLNNEVMESLSRSVSNPEPDFGFGYNHGLFYDGRVAWRAFVRLAYAPGYFWVAAQRYDVKYATGFPCPVKQSDVVAALNNLAPQVTFGWSPASGDLMLTNPWLPRGIEFVSPRTFFGLSTTSTKDRIYVGSSDVPSNRCSHLHLRLMGLSGLPPKMVSIGLGFAKLSGGWYRATPISLKRVAEMSADHLVKKILPAEES